MMMMMIFGVIKKMKKILNIVLNLIKKKKINYVNFLVMKH